MRINNSIIVLVTIFMSSFSSAATLCIPSKEAGAYASVNKQSDCTYQEPVALGASHSSKGQDSISGAHAPVVEAIPITGPAPHIDLAEPLTSWTLAAGKSVGRELKTWGDKSGWKVIWNLSTDWTIPADTTYEGNFASVAATVIETLASNGAFVRAKFYEGNKTVVINGPGVPAQ